MNVVNELRQLLGETAVLDANSLRERAAGIWRATEPLAGQALIRPSTTEEVSKALVWCAERGLKVVTQGGLTGLVHGADTDPDCIVLSLERMNAIESIDASQRCAVVQAGVTLQTLQEAAAPHGLMFPLDLGARGSATLGGNAATNAGGNRVIRYGMMRDMVLGAEAVLADGTVINSLSPLIKNNAGYDLKHLFVGSEGTLGVVTRLSLRLREAPVSRDMAFVALDSFDHVKALLRHMDQQLGGGLSAFETLWSDYYQLVTTKPAHSRPPVPHGHDFYVLLEAQGADGELDQQRFKMALESAFEQGLLVDAAVSQSESDCHAFWQIRDDVQQIFQLGTPLFFDVSLPIDRMSAYVDDVRSSLTTTEALAVYVFGHLGDGNLHFGIPLPNDRAAALRPQIEACVYGPLAEFKGSVSAEHGIGLEKKPWLSVSRSPEEIALMKTLKRALDPHNMLNPGKIFDV